MCIQMTLTSDQTSLSIEGDIYLEHAEVLRAIIQERIQNGSRMINLNMLNVCYIDCQSLRLLAALQKQLQSTDVAIAFEQEHDWQERLNRCACCIQ